jgi:L-fuculose-phosphate aldolase
MGDPSPPLFTFRSIGGVETVDGAGLPKNSVRKDSPVVLWPDLAGGLDGFSPGDRVTLLFVFDRASRHELYHHPRGDPSRPRRGVFCRRSPHRPNPIGITTVRIREISENEVKASGLDTWPGTPFLDLKPEEEASR